VTDSEIGRAVPQGFSRGREYLRPEAGALSQLIAPMQGFTGSASTLSSNQGRASLALNPIGKNTKGVLQETNMPQSLVQIYVHIVFLTKHRQPFLTDKSFRSRTHGYLAGSSWTMIVPHVHPDKICGAGFQPAIVLAGWKPAPRWDKFNAYLPAGDARLQGQSV
jgi:hypothetical protein